MPPRCERIPRWTLGNAEYKPSTKERGIDCPKTQEQKQNERSRAQRGMPSARRGTQKRTVLMAEEQLIHRQKQCIICGHKQQAAPETVWPSATLLVIPPRFVGLNERNGLVRRRIKEPA